MPKFLTPVSNLREAHVHFGSVEADRERVQTAFQDAAAEIGRLTGPLPAIRTAGLDDAARLTGRWTHDAIHGRHQPMNAHVLMTYYGTAQAIEWRDGLQRQVSRTRPGAITLIPAGHAANWDIEGPISVSHVYMPDALLQSSVESIAGGRRIALIDRVGFDDPVGSRMLEILAHEATHTPVASTLFIEQALDLLCVHLARGHSSGGAMAAPKVRRGLTDRQMRRLNEFMIAHLGDALSLDQLAVVAGLSRFHFCTVFGQTIGQTPHQWLTMLRMDRARDLLRNSDMPIVTIALAVGYETPSAFAAVFRRAEGRSPSAFRRGL